MAGSRLIVLDLVPGRVRNAVGSGLTNDAHRITVVGMEVFKVCGCCGERYSKVAWGELESLGTMDFLGEFQEYRMCSCGSSMVVVVDGPASEPATLTARIRALPPAEHFNFRKHARARARAIRGSMVKRPCPASGRWVVCAGARDAEAYEKVFAEIRSQPWRRGTDADDQ